MKTIIRRLILILLLVYCVSNSSLYAQARYDPQGTVKSQLMNLVHERYGSGYNSIGFLVLDSLIFYSSTDKQDIQDPYKTLQGCILFSTSVNNGESEPDTFISGMVKNGQIIWDNAPGGHMLLTEDPLYAQDINKGGEVDLLLAQSERNSDAMERPPFLYYYYILSWNGTRGKFINGFDSLGLSVLLGSDYCQLLVVNGDGIKEITTALPDIDMDWGAYKTRTFPNITYSWNGTQYGLWTKRVKTTKSAKLKNK